ncbi:hypothetical protein MASR2M78_26020 [Treponema sp.]
MQKRIWLASGLSIFILFLSSACDGTFGIQTYDLNGKAVDVRANSSSTTWGSVLSGASVTLTNTSSGKSLSSRLDSKGSFSFSAVPVGRYRINASKAGWTFVPRIVDMSGLRGPCPTSLGYTPSSRHHLYHYRMAG